MARPQTINSGGGLERQAWMAKLKSMVRKSIAPSHSIGWAEAIRELTLYGEGRTKRDDKAPGGLGKKKAIIKKVTIKKQ